MFRIESSTPQNRASPQRKRKMKQSEVRMDQVSREIRSKNMAAVRSKGNLSTEVALGKLLWSAGLRGYRKHWRVPGESER